MATTTQKTTSDHSQELASRPSTLALLKDILGSTIRSHGDTLEESSLSLFGQVTDTKALSHYNKVCGFKSLATVPATWPHVMAFPLQIKLLTQPGFPYPLAGLVHLKNCTHQHRPININEPIDIVCSIKNGAIIDKGQTFEVVTKISSGGRVVWEEVSTYLHRTGKRATSDRNTPYPTLPDYSENTHFEVPAAQGRAYARVSGDFNPIHLSSLSAKVLGFKTAIIHGMWSQARILAELQNELPNAFTITTDFKLPVFLPSRVCLSWNKSGDSTLFLLSDPKKSKPYILGSIQNASLI